MRGTNTDIDPKRIHGTDGTEETIPRTTVQSARILTQNSPSNLRNKTSSDGSLADMESISMPEDQAALHGGYKRGVTGGRATSANKSSSAALAGSGLGASGGLGDGNKMFKDARHELSLLRSFSKRRA